MSTNTEANPEPTALADVLADSLQDAADFLRKCRGTEPWEYYEEHAEACEHAAREVVRLSASEARVREALREVLEHGFDGTDSYEDPVCWYCQASRYGDWVEDGPEAGHWEDKTDHGPDCLWLKLRALSGTAPEPEVMPACRRGEHSDCDEPGVCECACHTPEDATAREE